MPPKKVILDSLRTLPYASNANLNKLKSDKQVVVFINKAINGVYAKVYTNETIDYERVKSDLIKYFVNKVNATRSIHEQFDYHTTIGFITALKISNTIKQNGKQIIRAENTTLNREDALFFLKNYKDEIAALEESRRNKSISELGTQKLKQYKEAVEKINSKEPSVIIRFPPLSTFQELSEQQIAIIKQMEPNKVINELNNCIKLSEKHHKELERLALTINVQSYYMEHIKNIVNNLNNSTLGKKASKSYLDGLTKNLIMTLEKTDLTFPLSNESSNTIESLMNFKKYIEQNKENIIISPKSEQLLNTQELEKLKRLLEDTHKVARYNKSNSRASSHSAINKHLTQQEHNFLYLFNKIIIQNKSSTSSERNELSIMLERSIGDMDFNRRLTRFSREKNPLASTYKQAISDIKYFGFKSKSPSESNQFFLDKCERAIDKITKEDFLELQDKMSLYEIGQLDNLAKLKEKMNKYNELGLITPRTKLHKLYEQVDKAASIFSTIEQQSNKDMQNGDILMIHSKKSLAVKNRKADAETALTHTFISKYSHATQIYIDPETNKPKLSHIYKNYQLNNINASDIIMSEIFRVDPIKLILKHPKDMEEQLKNHYGEDYANTVRNLFHKNILNLHKNNQERFKNISNPITARFKAGLADFHLYGGHTTKRDNNFRETHDEMYNTNKKLIIRNKMICSEFVARSLVAALYQTNEHLQEHLDVRTPVIRMPLKRENINRVHPERLINLLQDDGCLMPVNRPHFTEQLVNFDDLTKNKKALLQKPGQIFYAELAQSAKRNKNNTPQFIIEATQAFKVFADNEPLDIDLQAPRLVKFLKKNFSQIHHQINEKPNIFVQFIKRLKSFLHFKPEAQKTLERTIRDLEQIQTQSIKDKNSNEHPHCVDTTRHLRKKLVTAKEKADIELDKTDATVSRGTPFG